MNAENAFYKQILDSTKADLKGFKPEDFIPMSGTILAVKPPTPDKSEGGITYTEQYKDTLEVCVARVAAVPISDKDCPVEPGDWIIFRPAAYHPVSFDERMDLILIQYENGPGSDILGVFKAGPGEAVEDILEESEARLIRENIIPGRKPLTPEEVLAKV